MINFKFKLIIGLGNTGEKYSFNRHNLGFLVVDNFLNGEKLLYSSKNNSFIIKKNGIIFAKPKTFMNICGEEVSKLTNFYQITPSEILIIQDELDLEFGKIKVSFGNSDAGHKGIKDIIRALGTKDFYRLRFGIGRPVDQNVSVESYVLANFLPTEIAEIQNFDLSQYLNPHL